MSEQTTSKPDQKQTQFSLEQLPDFITRQQNPAVLSQFLEWLISNHKPLNNVLTRYKHQIASRVVIEGRGLRPIAVTLSGPASIAGFLLSLALFDSIRYVITSYEVASCSVQALKLSHLYYKHFVEELKILEPIVINFSDTPKYEEANMLLNIMKKGAIIVNGATAELGIWIGANSGIGRIIILRPTKDKTILKYFPM